METREDWRNGCYYNSKKYNAFGFAHACDVQNAPQQHKNRNRDENQARHAFVHSTHNDHEGGLSGKG